MSYAKRKRQKQKRKENKGSKVRFSDNPQYKFCQDCGGDMEELPTPQETPQTWMCMNCGAKLSTLTPETKKALKQQKRLFKKTFGREMGPDDPVFFDPYFTDYPRCMTEESQQRIEDKIEAVLLDNGMDPEKVEAFMYYTFGEGREQMVDDMEEQARKNYLMRVPLSTLH